MHLDAMSMPCKAAEKKGQPFMPLPQYSLADPIAAPQSPVDVDIVNQGTNAYPNALTPSEDTSSTMINDISY